MADTDYHTAPMNRSLLPLITLMTSAFALAAAVVRALPCHAVDLGTEPAEIAGAIRDFFRRGGA